ncbi:MAG: TetR/AcrR family transcriptional regulator [Roseburia sp.]|nr:TetR/AcrR family transcriptional regulator [Roseburia sp.]MCM1279837.1 TetR/AcrR family transcriptional regulator [Robinsoniella sp.]
MGTKPYHHGNLRSALITAGLELINAEGEENLSLRKVAQKCGVSNAAPYAHFNSKDEFIAAIQQHIMDLFTSTLEETAEMYADKPDLLPMLGTAYVKFFYQNPLYFDFLFSRKNIHINLSLDCAGEKELPPLKILKQTAAKTFCKVDMPESIIQNKIIAMWALVHGLSAIATMPNVEYDKDWETRIEEIIKSI